MRTSKQSKVLDRFSQIFENQNLPSSKTLPSVRRDRIHTLIKDRQFARVAELSSQFGISEVTVRSDLDHLERRGHVRRVHGGAVIDERPIRRERSFEEESVESTADKLSIGAAAAQMVQSGQTVIIDVGTTSLAVAQTMADRDDLSDVNVVTNGLNIAAAFEPVTSRFTVVVTGGTLRPLQHSLVDPFGGPVLERINADILFLGCNGVHATKGVTNVNLPEAEMKRRMMAASFRTIGVADGSKIGQVSVAWVCPIDELDLLITSSSAPEEERELLVEQGLEIVVV